MYFDTAEIVRFRVESEQWHDQTPQHMSKDPRATTAHGEEKQEPPYSILVSIKFNLCCGKLTIAGVDVDGYSRTDRLVG